MASGGAKTNRHITLFPSAARTTTVNREFYVQGGRGVHVIFDATAITSAPNVTAHIEALDPASGKWYTLLTGTAVTAAGTTQVLKVFPGATPAANSVANDTVPYKCRVRMAVTNTNSMTYSVGVNILE